MNVSIALGELDAAGTYATVLRTDDEATVAIQGVLTGDPTAVTIDVLGSLDGVTYGIIDTHVFTAGELTAANSFFFVADKPTPFMKLDVSTYTITTASTLNTFVRYNDR